MKPRRRTIQLDLSNNRRRALATQCNQPTTAKLLYTRYFAAGHATWGFPGPKLKENYYSLFIA